MAVVQDDGASKAEAVRASHSGEWKLAGVLKGPSREMRQSESSTEQAAVKQMRPKCRQRSFRIRWAMQCKSVLARQWSWSGPRADKATEKGVVT